MPERRPPNALEVGLRALRMRDHSVASLEERLERRGVDAAERDAAVARLQDLGYVDDERFARGRAAVLAERGAGDLLIAADLERHGISAAIVTDTIGALEPEQGRARAIVARRGASVQTARLLAARGFAEEVVESVVAAVAEDTLG